MIFLVLLVTWLIYDDSNYPPDVVINKQNITALGKLTDAPQLLEYSHINIFHL